MSFQNPRVSYKIYVQLIDEGNATTQENLLNKSKIDTDKQEVKTKESQ